MIKFLLLVYGEIALWLPTFFWVWFGIHTATNRRFVGNQSEISRFEEQTVVVGTGFGAGFVYFVFCL